MALKKHQFLDDHGTQEVINILGEISKDMLDRQIVNDLNSLSDDKHSPSVSLISALLQSTEQRISSTTSKIAEFRTKLVDIVNAVDQCTKISHMGISFVTGDIRIKVPDPDPNMIYFHRNSSSDKWEIMIYGFVKPFMIDHTGHLMSAEDGGTQKSFDVNDEGHLILTYEGADPGFSVDGNGHLVVDYDGEGVYSQWIVVGDADVSLTDYWKKSDIQSLKTAIGDIQPNYVYLTRPQIIAKVNAAFA